jgi:hypothetical protein
MWDNDPAESDEWERFYYKESTDASLRRRDAAAVLHAENRSADFESYVLSVEIEVEVGFPADRPGNLAPCLEPRTD